MNKLNVGDYVRTPKGIGKIENIEIDKQDTIIYLDCGITIDYITKDFTEEEINKMYPSSPEIIDILEVGDYVNGQKVIRLFNPTFLSMGELPYVITDKNKYEPQEIESIVTKEQFENISYKVGE